MRTRLARASLIAAWLMAGCGSHDTPEQVETQTVVPVTVSTAHAGAIEASVEATGVVTPAPGADFSVVAPAAARIAAMPVAEGDRVGRGALLIRFDIPALAADEASREAEVQQAHARVATASAALARAGDLFDRGVAARREVEEATQARADADAALAQAEAARAAARTLAQRAEVHAPFAGVVARRAHNPGDLVEPSASDVILRLIDPARLEITASVLIADLARIRVGAPARLTPETDPPTTLAVVSRPAAVDAATGAAPVRLGFRSATPLAVGTPVRVEIAAESHDRALLVPPAAVVREGADTTVFVAGSDGKAHRRIVSTGLVSASAVEILNGIRDGEQVIVDGQAGLPDGAAIAVAK